VREFTSCLRGRLFGTLFKLVGKPVFRRQTGDTLENLWNRSSCGGGVRTEARPRQLA
jgi:hypothetical protein